MERGAKLVEGPGPFKEGYESWQGTFGIAQPQTISMPSERLGDAPVGLAIC